MERDQNFGRYRLRTFPCRASNCPSGRHPGRCRRSGSTGLCGVAGRIYGGSEVRGGHSGRGARQLVAVTDFVHSVRKTDPSSAFATLAGTTTAGFKDGTSAAPYDQAPRTSLHGRTNHSPTSSRKSVPTAKPRHTNRFVCIDTNLFGCYTVEGTLPSKAYAN